MKQTLLILFLVSLSLFTGCTDRITGSGREAVKTYNYTDFTEVYIKDACKATVVEGDSFSIVIEVDDNILPYVEVYQSGAILKIGLKGGYSYNDIQFRATVTLPSLTALKVKDATNATVTRNLTSTALLLSANDASGISGNITSSALTIYAEDASDITLSGTATNLDIRGNDASDIQLKSLVSETVTVDINDASEAVVQASHTIKGTVSDASMLYYYGEPTAVTVETKDASKVIKMTN